MHLILPHKLPGLFYQAFIKDGVRLYRVMPGNLRIRFWFVFVIQFISALTETFTLLVISLFAMSIAAPEAAMNNFMVKAALSLAPPLAEFCSEPRQMVIFTCSLMIAFVTFKTSLATLVAHKTTLFSESVSVYIGREALRRYLNKNYFWHISPASDSVMHRLAHRGFLSQFLVMLLLLYSNAFCCLAFFVSLFIAEPKLTVILVAIFSSASISTYTFLRRRIDRAGLQVSETGLQESAAMTGLTQGIREVLIYRQQDVFLNKVVESILKGLPARAFLAFSGTMPSQLLEFVGFSSIAVITIIMILNDTPMPQIIASSSMLMLTAWRVLPAVNRSLSYAVGIRGIRPMAWSCLDLLETFIKENPDELPAPDPNFRFDKNLALSQACFRYPTGAADALSELCLSINKGESIGLIGSSGAGKSTLALLLSGLVSPRQGDFLVDGEKLSPAGLAAYVQHVGFVPQSPLLTQGAVADNVAFSQWGQEYDREAVREACRMAAMDFVLDHPAGIDMPLAAGGAGLSGGQAQRVSIARALFAKPDIIIFDEATSALDQASENVIKNTIETLQGRITSIIIAHRLTTVENCDRLFWIEGGRVKAAGTPSEILPLYQEVMDMSQTEKAPCSQAESFLQS
ncbi:MAG: ABC transporter ATP-binding protein/permease [Candidatus Adiutrix sp.]|nr:ABC transporter ATP-binding protein/permease [Candidatus Adiutrix sp.]